MQKSLATAPKSLATAAHVSEPPRFNESLATARDLGAVARDSFAEPHYLYRHEWGTVAGEITFSDSSARELYAEKKNHYTRCEFVLHAEAPQAKSALGHFPRH